jgi:hypothetical protein
MKILPGLRIKVADKEGFPKVEELSWGLDGGTASSPWALPTVCRWHVPRVLVSGRASLGVSAGLCEPRCAVHRSLPLDRANRKERRCANIASPKHRTREASPSYN